MCVVRGSQQGMREYRGRQKSLFIDFEALGAVPKDRLRQAKPASICLKTAPSKADTLLPEDHHYQVLACDPWVSAWREGAPLKQGACTDRVCSQ